MINKFILGFPQIRYIREELVGGASLSGSRTALGSQALGQGNNIIVVHPITEQNISKKKSLKSLFNM